MRRRQGSASSLSDRPRLDPHKKNIKKDITRYDYKTVHSHLQSLENEGSVRRKFDPEKLGRSQEIIFEPTLLGLVRYLAARHPAAESVKRLAQDYEGMLPLVFRKWSYFQKFKPPQERVEIADIRAEVDAIVCKALNHAANEIVRTCPANIAFAFDIDELTRTRNAWHNDPYSGKFSTVDEYIETELRSILEPRALLLDELLHPYPWDEPNIAGARRRALFAAEEPEILWSAIAGDAELRSFAIEWLWRQRLEALREAKRTDRVEQHILNPTYILYPFKLRMENPSSFQILMWDHHCFEEHAERESLADWDSLGSTRTYPTAEHLKSCPYCGKKTSDLTPSRRYSSK